MEKTIAIWQPSWMYANEAKDQLQRRLSQMIACVETPEYSILNQLNISTENNDMKTYVNLCTNIFTFGGHLGFMQMKKICKR